MKPKGNFQFSMGGASILMIFVVLCLTAFGVLSYVTANADNRISAKNAEAVRSYYKADGQIQAGLKQIDTALLTAKADAKQAADAGGIGGLKNKALYQGSTELPSILSAKLPLSAKYDACYRLFARALLSQCPGVVLQASPNGDDTLRCSLTADADRNRKIEVKLTVGSYTDADRYQIANEQLIGTQSPAADPVISDDGEALHLWQGGSKAP